MKHHDNNAPSQKHPKSNDRLANVWRDITRDDFVLGSLGYSKQVSELTKKQGVDAQLDVLLSSAAFSSPEAVFQAIDQNLTKCLNVDQTVDAYVERCADQRQAGDVFTWLCKALDGDVSLDRLGAAIYKFVLAHFGQGKQLVDVDTQPDIIAQIEVILLSEEFGSGDDALKALLKHLSAELGVELTPEAFAEWFEERRQVLRAMLYKSEAESRNRIALAPNI